MLMVMAGVRSVPGYDDRPRPSSVWAIGLYVYAWVFQRLNQRRRVGLMSTSLEYLKDVMVLLAILAFLVILAGVLVGILGSISTIFRADIDGRLRTLWRVEAKINLLLEHAGIEFDPYKGLPQELADALGRGQKIRAIKLWRGASGASLREAKEFIEEVQRRGG
jgi:hypothetical protein